MNSKFKKIICATMLIALIVTLFEGSQATYAATLDDGTYTIDYVIKKPEDESVSMANDYWDKPATVIVSGGAINMQMTINHSEWVTKFKVPSGSSYVDAKVVSRDSGTNTRLTQFSLASLDKSMLSQIHVTVPEIDYDHDYTIRFVYNTDTLKLISKPESTATPQLTASANPGSKDVDTSTVNPTESVKESSQPNKGSATPTKEPSSAATSAPDTTHAATPKAITEPLHSASNSNGKDAGDSSSSTGTEAAAGKVEQEINQQTDDTVNDQAENDIASEQSSTDTNIDGVTREGDVTADQETVELAAVLDGVTVDDSATVVESVVSEDSSKKKTTIIIAFLALLLVAGAITVANYRKRKARKS